MDCDKCKCIETRERLRYVESSLADYALKTMNLVPITVEVSGIIDTSPVPVEPVRLADGMKPSSQPKRTPMPSVKTVPFKSAKKTAKPKEKQPDSASKHEAVSAEAAPYERNVYAVVYYTCRLYDVTLKQFYNTKKVQQTVAADARATAAHIVLNELNLSASETARRLNIGQSSIGYMLKKVEKWLVGESKSAIQERLRKITEQVNALPAAKSGKV